MNEFCERFCFYGMKSQYIISKLRTCANNNTMIACTAVLILYLRDYLGFNEDDSVVLYHTFSMLCYFTPIFGAILSDNYIGKFKYLNSYTQSIIMDSIFMIFYEARFFTFRSSTLVEAPFWLGLPYLMEYPKCNCI